MEEYGRENQVTFGQQIADYDEHGPVRHLYLVDGDPQVPGRRWLEHGMGDFGGSRSALVHPLRDAGDRSPMGAYAVFGDPTKMHLLRKFFVSKGMSVDVNEIGPVGAVSRSVLLTVSVVVLLTVSMVGAVVVSGTRRYAVGRLHGLPYRSLLIADLRGFGVAWSISGLGVLTVAAAVITLRFGSSGLGLFIATAITIQLAVFAAAATAHAIFLALVTSVEIPSAMKGELPAGALTATAYGLRLVGVTVALGAIATTVTLAADVASRDRSREAFDSLGQISAITLGNAYTMEDQNQLDDVVGPWLRTADHDKGLLLAAQLVFAGDDPRWRGRNAMIVNDAFLTKQPVRLADGGELRGARADKITLLIPDADWDARSQLASQLGLDTLLAPTGGGDRTFERAAPDQRFFTYAPDSGSAASANVWNTSTSHVTDPVIVVLPSSQGWLSDSSYVAFASQGGALATDPDTVSATVSQQPQLERFVRGVTPVADKAAASLTEQTVQLRLALFTAVVSCLVVAMSGVAAALIHTRRLAQRIFVRHLFGWSFARTYRTPFAVESLLLAGLIVWIPWQVAAQRRDLQAWQVAGGPLPVDLPSVTAAQVAAIAVLAAVTTGGYLWSLFYAHRRVIRGGASVA